MITTADYYKTNKPTTANSREFDYSTDEKSIFPESIYIGELESVTGHKAPVLIPLAETNGICFLTHSCNKDLIHQTMQAIALRLILSLPAPNAAAVLREWRYRPLKHLCKFVSFPPVRTAVSRHPRKAAAALGASRRTVQASNDRIRLRIWVQVSRQCEKKRVIL